MFMEVIFSDASMLAARSVLNEFILDYGGRVGLTRIMDPFSFCYDRLLINYSEMPLHK